jgi:hypothetical protein
MSTSGEESIRIDEDLVATKEPGRQAWEITDAEGARGGRVVETAGGFHALKPVGNGFYSVGTFVSLETAARALTGSSAPPMP